MLGLDPVAEIALATLVVTALLGVFGLFAARKSDKGTDETRAQEDMAVDRLEAERENSDKQRDQIIELVGENHRLWQENTRLQRDNDRLRRQSEQHDGRSSRHDR